MGSILKYTYLDNEKMFMIVRSWYFRLFFLLSIIRTQGAASMPMYPVSQIPDEMKKGMYAVIRQKEVRLEIQSISSSSYYLKQVITILNPQAKNYATISVGYDKLRTIKLFKATVYDAMGFEVKRLKQSDINDRSDFDGYSLLSDNRTKSADMSHSTYPYTLEFEYEVQFKYLYSAPDFFLYRDDEVSTQLVTYSVSYPIELEPRYKLFKTGKPTIEKLSDGRSQMRWKFENIVPQKFEKNSVDFEKAVPNIKVSPDEFEFGGYSGKMNTWKNFGLWQYKVNEGRGALPEATRQKVRELTRGAKSNEEKTRLLYEYMQNKTRYVSIQLGIGGLQPFEAKTVDETGYGDCKALSNYMVSLLQEAGIKGYYTTIMAGEGESEVDTEFPSAQANHVIVTVPNGADTLWLECTSQTNPFGWMGKFTDNRYALMVTEQGGFLIKTPSHPAERNIQSRVAEVHLDLAGNARAKVRTKYTGLQYENDGLQFVVTQPVDDQKKWLQRTTQIPTFDIGKFSMKNTKTIIPSAAVEVELILNRFATVSGKRIFLTPNLMNRSGYIPEKLDQRKTAIVRRMPYIDIDTIRYIIPAEIYPEFVPDRVSIQSRFGEYESNYEIDQGTLIYIRRIKINKGEFPAETYNELTEFYKNINKADNTKMVFLSKT
jgi:transglutaminase-like putative cysteine protease